MEPSSASAAAAADTTTPAQTVSAPVSGTDSIKEDGKNPPEAANDNSVNEDAGECMSNFQLTVSACAPKSIGGGAAKQEDVDKFGSAQTAGAYSKALGNAAASGSAQTENCKTEVIYCMRRCQKSANAAKSPQMIALYMNQKSACKKQYANQRPVQEATKQAQKGQKDTKEIEKQVGAEPNPYPGSGATPAVPESGLTPGDLIPKLPSVAQQGSGYGGSGLNQGQTASVNPNLGAQQPGYNNTPATNTQNTGESSDPLDQATKEYEDPAAKKRRSLLSQSGLFGEDGLMEGMGGQMGSQSALARAQKLFEALTSGQKGTADTQTAAATAAAQAYAPERGKGGFVNRKGAAQAAGTRGPAVAVTNTSGNGGPQRSIASVGTGAPVAQAANAGWNPNGQGPGELGRHGTAARENQYGDLNARMRMQTEDGGGGGGMRAASVKSVPLSAYLPNGDMYQGGRNVAGQQQQALGIQNAHTDIWGLISKRMRIRCNDGRLKDCR